MLLDLLGDGSLVMNLSLRKYAVEMLLIREIMDFMEEEYIEPLDIMEDVLEANPDLEKQFINAGNEYFMMKELPEIEAQQYADIIGEFKTADEVWDFLAGFGVYETYESMMIEFFADLTVRQAASDYLALWLIDHFEDALGSTHPEFAAHYETQYNKLFGERMPMSRWHMYFPEVDFEDYETEP